MLPSGERELKELEEMDLILIELFALYKIDKKQGWAYGKFLPLIHPRYPDLSEKEAGKEI